MVPSTIFYRDSAHAWQSRVDIVTRRAPTACWPARCRASIEVATFRPWPGCLPT